MNGTYHRVSDTILKWVLGLVGVGLTASIGLLLDIRVRLAEYQSDVRTIKEQVKELKSWQNLHDEHDRQRFQALEGRR